MECLHILAHKSLEYLNENYQVNWIGGGELVAWKL